MGLKSLKKCRKWFQLKAFEGLQFQAFDRQTLPSCEKKSIKQSLSRIIKELLELWKAVKGLQCQVDFNKSPSQGFYQKSLVVSVEGYVSLIEEKALIWNKRIPSKDFIGRPSEAFNECPLKSPIFKRISSKDFNRRSLKRLI